MNTYHLRLGDQDSGPFEESQLEDLWDGGQTQPGTMVRLESEEAWQPLPQVMDKIAARKRDEEQQDRWRQQRSSYAAQSSSRFQRDKKKPLLAALVSFLLPGAGHFYAGAPVTGILCVLGTIAILAAISYSGMEGNLLPAGYGACGLLSGILAYASAIRANEKLRRRLQV